MENEISYMNQEKEHFTVKIYSLDTIITVAILISMCIYAYSVRIEERRRIKKKAAGTFAFYIM